MSDAFRTLTVDEIDEVFGGKNCYYCEVVQICDSMGNCSPQLNCVPTPCRS